MTGPILGYQYNIQLSFMAALFALLISLSKLERKGLFYEKVNFLSDCPLQVIKAKNIKLNKTL